MKILIIGRKKDTFNYEKYLSNISVQAETTLSLGALSSCDAVILPGGGDVTPAFFGEHNYASRNIDTELDILQLQAADYCIGHGIPLMGICKGMQVINVALGGTLIQDLPTSSMHKHIGQDQHHSTHIAADSFLAGLYGEQMIVNSAHHQGVGRLGKHLIPIQWCDEDNCVEAYAHDSLPVIGLQWHPERLDHLGINGLPLLSYFVSLI